MNAMIRKELRECLPYAGLALVAMILVLFGIAQNNARDNAQIVGEQFQLLTQFGFPVMGILLGALQTMRELRLEKWSFLVHRPMSRTRIFIAKLIAAAAMLVTAYAIVIAGLAWWGATPGHVAAPFSARMLKPAIADAMCGFVWYFGTMLTCLRRARWYGSRVAPLCVPLVATLLAAFAAQSLAQAALIYLTALAILVPGAWGNFLAAGSYEPQPRGGRAMQWVSVGIGMCVLLYMAGGMATGLLSSIRSREDVKVRMNQYAMMRDGEILRASYGSSTPDKIEWTDLQGKQVDRSGMDDQQSLWRESLFITPLPIVRSDDLQLWKREGIPSFRSPTRFLKRLPWPGPIAWYYVAPTRLILGFDPTTRSYIGGIGPGGFVDAPKLPAPFDGLLPFDPFVQNQINSVIADQQAVYQVDLAKRRLELIFSTPPGETLTGVAQTMDTQNAKTPAMHFIATNKSIHIIDPSGKERFVLPTDPSKHTHVGVGYDAKRDVAIVWYQGDYQRQPFQAVPQRVIEVSQTGQTVRELPAINRVEFVRSAERPIAMEPIYVAASPAAAGGLYVAAKWFDEPMDTSENKEDFHRATTVIAVMGVIGAVGGLLLSRRYGRHPATQLAWTAGGFAFALPGVATMLSVPSKPGTTACFNCQKNRFLNESNCRHCGAAFPPPPADGTEIFE